MDKTIVTMFALLRFALNGEELKAKSLGEEEAKALYVLSKKHDIAHIIAYGLEKSGFDMPENVLAAFRKQKITALYRSSIMEEELEKIKELFEKEKIEHIPLKGAVIKKLYPEEWMRTSCDIDVLVREEDIEKAKAALTENLLYKSEEKKNYHDISMFSENGVHLELHFSINENMDSIDKMLSKVWDYTSEKTGCEKFLSTEFFMFHIISHMMYHFKGGGCGIRQLMDLYILRKKIEYDETVLRSYLKYCNTEVFYDEMCKLSVVWFEKEEHTVLSKQAESYIINGGVYGSESQHIAIKQSETKGKAGYIAERIFMPKKSLEILYPPLKKYPFMYPFYTVARWTKVLKKDVRMRVRRESAVNSRIESKDVMKFAELMKNLKI